MSHLYSMYGLYGNIIFFHLSISIKLDLISMAHTIESQLILAQTNMAQIRVPKMIVSQMPDLHCKFLYWF